MIPLHSPLSNQSLIRPTDCVHPLRLPAVALTYLLCPEEDPLGDQRLVYAVVSDPTPVVVAVVDRVREDAVNVAGAEAVVYKCLTAQE